jgi:hypothetical protein
MNPCSSVIETPADRAAATARSTRNVLASTDGGTRSTWRTSSSDARSSDESSIKGVSPVGCGDAADAPCTTAGHGHDANSARSDDHSSGVRARPSESASAYASPRDVEPRTPSSTRREWKEDSPIAAAGVHARPVAVVGPPSESPSFL